MIKRAFAELQVVELAEDVVENEGTVARGTVGTVVHVHDEPGEAYLVEISDSDGQTKAMLTLLPTQIRAHASNGTAANKVDA
jgi:hypothetical protein